jgi:uncharacterized membrane protein YccC
MPALPAMLIALLLAVPANHFAHDRATASENATIAQAQALAGARERWQIVRYGCYELCADATRVEPAWANDKDAAVFPRNLFNRFVLSSVLAAVGAYWICSLLGIGPADQAWAVLTALTVLATDYAGTRDASRDRVLATIAGGAVAALLVAVMPRLSPGDLALGVAVIAVLHALVFQWRPGLHIFGSTAALLFLVGADAGPTVRLAEQRFEDVGLGVAVSLVVSTLVLLLWRVCSRYQPYIGKSAWLKNKSHRVCLSDVPQCHRHETDGT